jgi:hypothetical protein
MFREKMRSMTAAERNGRFDNVGDPGRRARFLSTYEEGVESPYVGQRIFAFEKMFGEMEDDLSRSSVLRRSTSPSAQATTCLNHLDHSLSA